MKSFSTINKTINITVMLLIECTIVVMAFAFGLDNLYITCAGHVGANLVCSLVLIAIYLGLTQKHFQNNNSLKIFLLIVFVIFICINVDSFAWLMDSIAGEAIIWEYVKAAVVVVCYYSCVLFALYIKSMVDENDKTIKIMLGAIKILAITGAVLCIIFIIFGNLFTFPDNQLVCNNTDLIILYSFELVSSIICIFIVIRAKLTKKWLVVAIYWVFTAVITIGVCFVFDSPIIQQNLNAAAVVFSYCTTFIELGGGNKALEDSFYKYITVNNEEFADSNAYDTDAAVVICNIRNMKNIAPYFDTKIITDIYNDFLEKMNEVVTNKGGVILAPMSFGIKCVFRRRNNTNDYIINAVQAAKEMLIAVDSLNEHNRTINYPAIYTGMAVTEGNATVCKVGGAERMRLSVRGELISECYYIEKNCSEGEILLSQDVFIKIGEEIQISDIRHVKSERDNKYYLVYRLGF